MSISATSRAKADFSLTEPRLSRKHLAILILQGIVEWYLFALVIKHLGPTGMFQGAERLITYGMTVPVVLPAVFFASWSVGFTPQATLAPITVVCGTALLFDAVGMSWFQNFIYGSDQANALAGASCILWGVGIALLLALGISLRARSLLNAA